MDINLIKQIKDPKTGDRIEDLPYVQSQQIETFEEGEYTKTNANSEKNVPTTVYEFGEYEVEVKLDSEGRLLYIKGDLAPKQKRCYKELFYVDEEFPKMPLE